VKAKILILLNAALILTTTSGAAFTCCREVQKSLRNVVGANDLSMKVSSPGALSALRSEANMAGVRFLETQDEFGRTQITKVGYYQKLGEDDSSDTQTDICTPGTTPAKLYASVTTPRYREVELTLNDADFKTFCETHSEYRAEMTRRKLDVLYHNINKDVVTDLIANYGEFYDISSSAAVSVPMVNTDGSANYWGETMILDEFEKAEISGKPLLIGHGLLNKYVRLQKIGCCNDGGADMSQIGEFNFYRDAQVDKQQSGANHIIALAPGTTQFISNVDFVGDFEVFDGKNAKTTIVDPLTGMTLNMTVVYNFCQGGDSASSWVIKWSVNYGLFTLPDNLAAAPSPWEGVNGIFHFQATCGDANVCDNQS